MSPHALRPSFHDFKCDSDLFRKYGISDNGFLPAEAPLQFLPDEYYLPWELLIHNLPLLLKTDHLRIEIDSLDVLQTDFLRSEPERRRAYVILAFLAQGYIWGGTKAAEVIPPCLSVPFLEISRKLELPPVLTYAASNLWNFTSTSGDFSDLETLKTLHTFTGTQDEVWFFMVSVAMEAKAGCAIPAMCRAIEATYHNDYDIIEDALHNLRQCIEDVSRLLERMYEKNDPSVFFNQIRPYLAGSKNMAEAGLPNGVFFDLGDGNGEWTQLRGGSNGQSSLIQFFDISLGVNHTGEGNNTPHSPGSSPKSAAGPSFHEEVRDYMPGRHRRFLEHVKEMGSIREFVMQSKNTAKHQRIREAYFSAVDALTDFRSKHIQLVTRYIILPSRQKSVAKKQNLASASSQHSGCDQKLRGTGGTALLPFLQQSRDETSEAANLSIPNR
ncbi:indoleamine 2,3-dioxygenase subfamily [Hortaea werneckii]|nr:indoleamine 2,3-dioxygenase subfamily [Hortaea werneckii]